MAFIQECFIRNYKDKIDLITKLTLLGYKPMYCLWRNNIEGNNIVCEMQTWHCTDSDNKPQAIDCGSNEDLFLALAALRDDSDKDQWIIYDTMDCTIESRRQISWILCDEDTIEQFGWYDQAYNNMRKATVEEIIEHFKSN